MVTPTDGALPKQMPNQGARTFIFHLSQTFRVTETFALVEQDILQGLHVLLVLKISRRTMQLKVSKCTVSYWLSQVLLGDYLYIYIILNVLRIRYYCIFPS